MTRQHQQWGRRCFGCDHAFAFASGSGPNVVGSFSSEFFELWKNCTFFVVDGGVKRVDVTKDVVIPYPTRQIFQGENQSFVLHNGEPRGERNITVYLRGAAGNHYPLRRQLLETFEKYTHLKDILVSKERVHSWQFSDEFKKSKFCLMPRGITPASSRFVEAILSGCINVIVSDEWQPCFPFAMNYSNLIIRHPESDVDMLPTRLLQLPEQRVNSMLHEVEKAWRHFRWPYPPQPEDAVHLALEEWLVKSFWRGNRWLVSLASKK